MGDNRIGMDHPSGVGIVGMFGIPDFGAHAHHTAWVVLNSFIWPPPQWTAACVDEGYRHAPLEAVQRVEDKEWP